MENKEKKIDKSCEEIEKLPPEMQRTVVFIIKNFDLIKKMCENSEMTEEEIQKWTATAKERGDNMMLGLLAAVQVFNEK